MTSEEILRSTIEYAKELILFFDKTGAVSYMNSASKKCLGLDEAEEMNISEIFPEIFSVQNGTLVILNASLWEECITDAYRKNRTCFPVKFTCYDNGEGRYEIIAEDGTELVMLRKRSEKVDEQIAEALKVKSEFTANVTHELRTPVNGISGNTRELLEQEDDPAKLRLLNLIERGCQDMHAIINNVLDFSKLEAGKFTLEPREFVFRDMIDYAVSNHKNKINEKGLDFFLTVGEDIPQKVIGDELRIVQILNNLLSNAVKFTSVGKIILQVVKTAQSEKRIELFFLVIDSGIGIAKENQDKLFQSFSQVDASISRRFGGTGLGLNISKQLVEMMGGSIRLESELGKGSMFSFHIWLDVPETELREASPTSGEAAKATFTLDSVEDQGAIWEFGSRENLEELDKKLSKLVLCIEMENWEKAETFADTVKKLTAASPKEIKTVALRMKMSVQKEDHDAAMTAYENLKKSLEQIKEGEE